jgi:hypothetical protein
MCGVAYLLWNIVKNNVALRIQYVDCQAFTDKALIMFRNAPIGLYLTGRSAGHTDQ